MDSELNILLLTIIFIIIIFIVWKSSEVRDIPPNFETINIGGKKNYSYLNYSYNYYRIIIFLVRRSASLISQTSTTSTNTIEENLSSSVEDIADNIFAEASESFNNSNGDSYRNATHTDDEQLTEEERIIRDMDRDLPSHSSDDRRRRISLETPQTSSAAAAAVVELNENSIETKKEDEVEKISIKLKFLNDEIKVDKQAYLNETVLSFKR